ncbi:MAG: YihY/virulence factor BrkB family protein, partial [Deltaproteobacteria bacterium]|nr:YihY/virulence factor BrkB family protein [Deltaproteobacteria bacterium]
YLSIMLLGPVLVIMSSSFTVFITTQVTDITQEVELVGMFSPVIFLMLKMVPYGLIWLLFTVMYMLMPNTRVRFLPGLLAGVIAGTAYQIAQLGYISFQIGVARYNAIYGSFAALPLFLIWLQVSWLIVLFGAEISYAGQNCDQYEFEEDTHGVSLYFKQFTSLLVARLIIKKFSRGEPSPTANAVSGDLSLPTRTVQQLIDKLVESRILSRTNLSDNHTPTYQPAVDTSILTVQYVIDALAKNGTNDLPLNRTRSFDALSDTLQSFNETVQNSSANRLLKDV